jgi:hypothetical protein
VQDVHSTGYRSGSSPKVSRSARSNRSPALC